VELLEALGGKLVGPVVAYLVLLSASAVRDELGGGMTLDLAKAERRGGRPLAQGLAEGLPKVAVRPAGRSGGSALESRPVVVDVLGVGAYL
jgi:hypothetical protein